MDDTPFTPLDGRCTCGDVRYRMHAAPLIVHCCHCRWCQRETGASFALNALVETECVELLAGRPEAVDTPSESGQGQKILLPALPRGGVEPLFGGGRSPRLRARGDAGRAGPAAAGRAHLHRVEAALGDAG